MWAEGAGDAVAGGKKTGKSKVEIFGCGEQDTQDVAALEKLTCLTKVYGESTVATPDGRVERKANNQ